MAYSIGVMAQKLNVAPSTLRYYDKEGLLPFVERSNGGVRIFKDEDYAFLKIIHCLKASGMQIKDIREFISLVMQGDETIDARLELFKKRRSELEKQMADLQETLEALNYKCWYFKEAEKKGDVYYYKNMPEDELPEQINNFLERVKEFHSKKIETP